MNMTTSCSSGPGPLVPTETCYEDKAMLCLLFVGHPLKGAEWRVSSKLESQWKRESTSQSCSRSRRNEVLGMANCTIEDIVQAPTTSDVLTREIRTLKAEHRMAKHFATRTIRIGEDSCYSKEREHRGMIIIQTGYHKLAFRVPGTIHQSMS